MSAEGVPKGHLEMKQLLRICSSSHLEEMTLRQMQVWGLEGRGESRTSLETKEMVKEEPTHFPKHSEQQVQRASRGGGAVSMTKAGLLKPRVLSTEGDRRPKNS